MSVFRQSASACFEPRPLLTRKPCAGVFKKVSWTAPTEERTFHKIPLPEPPLSVTESEDEMIKKPKELYQSRWAALNAGTNARVAMTLVR